MAATPLCTHKPLLSLAGDVLYGDAVRQSERPITRAFVRNLVWRDPARCTMILSLTPCQAQRLAFQTGHCLVRLASFGIRKLSHELASPQCSTRISGGRKARNMRRRAMLSAYDVTGPTLIHSHGLCAPFVTLPSSANRALTSSLMRCYALRPGYCASFPSPTSCSLTSTSILTVLSQCPSIPAQPPLSLLVRLTQRSPSTLSPRLKHRQLRNV